MTFEEIRDWVASLCPPITADCVELAALAMSSLEDTITEGHDFKPMITFTKNKRLGVGLIPQGFRKEHHDRDKEAAAGFIRQLRVDSDAVTFAMKAWLAMVERSELNADGSMKMRPSEHPSKKEVGLVQLYLKGGRTIAFCADITHHPNGMHKWIVQMDTAQEGQRIEGRFK